MFLSELLLKIGMPRFDKITVVDINNDLRKTSNLARSKNFACLLIIAISDTWDQLAMKMDLSCNEEQTATITNGRIAGW